jgi:gliding motility-associated-like protein
MPFSRLLVSLLKRFMLALIGIVLFTSIQAQSDREFWFAAPEVTSQHSDNPIFLRFTTYSKDAIITIDQPANSSFTPITINLVSNSTYSLPFTSFKEIVENKPGNTELNYGIRITATASISAYYELASANNPEIFPLKGNVSKGLDFIIPGQTRYNNQTYVTFPAHNGFAIVATEDNTTINIDLTRPDEKGNTKITVSLNKGQTYAVNAYIPQAPHGIGGSRVTSDKPVCVTVYDDSIVIGGWDLIGDQIVPINNTGKKFIAVKGELSAPGFFASDFCYIWPTEDNTEIIINGNPLTRKYNRGESFEFQLSNFSAYITTDKNVYIFQLTGTGTEAAATSLPSIECTGSQSVSFVRPSTGPLYLNILCKTADIGNFSIKGDATLITSSMFSVVPGSAGIWQFARINISSNAILNALINIYDATSITNSTGLFHLGFLNSSGGGSRLGYFSNYAQVTLAPVITSTACFGSDIKLAATELLNVSYQWTGPNNFNATIANPTITNATMKDSGMYTVVANINGCGISTDSVRVVVHPKPTIHFLKSIDTVCLGNASEIHYALDGKAPWTLEYSNGTVNSIITNIGQSPNFFTVTPAVKTIYSVVNIKDSNSCVVSVNASNEKDTIVVNKLPVANFDFSTLRCEQRDILFSDQSKGDLDSVTNWHWNFANGKTRDELTKSPFNEQFTVWGTYKIKLAVQTRLGCNSDTVVKSIYINPNPTVGFELPEVCLNDKDAQFKDTSFLVDNNVKSFDYLWDFNVVPPVGKKLPIIPSAMKTDKNPTIQYNDWGDYTVSLRVTHKITGCIATDTSDFRVNGAVPKSQFKIINADTLCSNQAVKIIDSSWVDFGTIGKLIIKWGDGSPDSVVNDPSIDPSSNKIYQHYYANISAPNNLKLDYQITLTAYSGGSCFIGTTKNINIIPPPEMPIIQTTKDYLCLFDTLTLNTSTLGGIGDFSYLYTSDNSHASIFGNVIKGLLNGSAQVSMKAIDRKNCIYPYQNIFSINVRDIPTAEILPGDSIICNGDAINIAGAGRGYDNSPISTYSWYRNDTLISTLSTNSISNNIPGWYKLTVNDGKCNSLATAGKKVSPLNITKYTFSHVPNICVGVPLIINTTAVDQPNVHYNWNFGDGFNYLKASPGNHKYIDKGDFKIKLNVTNDYCPRYNYLQIGNTVKVLSPVASKTFRHVFLANQDNVIVTKTDPGYVIYKWNPSININNANIPNPIFNGDRYTEYSLTRTDTVSSCAVIDEYEIVVTREVFVKVPNAFTPNNDGLNDVLKVEHSVGVLPDGFDFKIYNRWGKLMFHKQDINIGWDGRDANGVLQEMDGYNYVLYYKYNQTTKSPDGQFVTNTITTAPITGTIILFR